MLKEEIVKTGNAQAVFDDAGISGKALVERSLEINAILLEHPLVHAALQRLSHELPGGLYYHNLEHTMNVLSEVVRLALIDGLNEDDITLLGIAAAWHDTGFIKQIHQNEPVAASWTRQAMEQQGYSNEEIRDVEQAILDTQLKPDLEYGTLVQIATGRLSPWLLDADLSNFGLASSFRNSLRVYAEFSQHLPQSALELQCEPGKSYIANTIKLMDHHTWHSRAAAILYRQQEAENLKNLGVLLANLYSGTEISLQRIWNKLLETDGTDIGVESSNSL